MLVSEIASTPVAAGRRHWLGLAVLLCGSFVTVLDAMIVQIAIPSIARGLHAGGAALELMIAGYSLGYGVLLVTGGRLGDIHGRKRTFLIGMAAFTVASVLCGVAPSAATLVVARVVQGMTASLVLPQVLASIRVGFNGDERRRAFGIMGLVIGIAAASGQLVGGFLIGSDLWGLGWRLVFLVNLPIGIAAVSFGLRWLDESRVSTAIRLDLRGVALSALGLGFLLAAFIGLRALGIGPAAILGVVALPILALFVTHETRFEQTGHAPLLSIRLFRVPYFVTGALLCFLFYASMAPYYFSFAVFLQFGTGRTPLEAAFVLTPISAAFALVSLLVPRLTQRYGRKVLNWGGMIYLAAFGVLAVLLFLMPARPSIVALMPVLLVIGAVQGAILTPLLNAILGMLPETHAGMASGVLATMQQLGVAFGVAIVGIILFGLHETGGVLPVAAATAGFGRAVLMECGVVVVIAVLLRRFAR
ncbi:MAG TPA: MFS transporter [Dongiaceae bacterium]|nr:MFS transporter [Dongiaceae bacterium]